MNNCHFHVALASDENYAEFVAVVMVSLFESNHWQDFTSIHLLSNGIDQNTINQLQRHVPEGKGELKVYDVSSLKKDLGIDVPATIAITSYARLFLPDLLDKSIDRVLYLDCDLVVCEDLKDFYTIPFQGMWVAGVRDTLSHVEVKTSVGLNECDDYLNAGVLMFNLTAWRANNVTKQCLEFLVNHDGKVVHHDQGIINGVCGHTKLVVHPKFNVTTCYYSHSYSLLKKQNVPFYSQQEVEDAISKPAIVHFTEGFFNRPWIDNSIHPLRHLYRKYRSMTLWPSVSLRKDKRSLGTRVAAWSFINLPYWLYQLIGRMMSVVSRIIK